MATKRACEQCSAEFEPIRPNARYCSAPCRSKAYRQRRAAAKKAAEDAAAAGTSQSSQELEGCSVCASTLAELREVKQERSAQGQALLVLAKRIDLAKDNDEEPGAALASMVLRLGLELDRLVGRARSAAQAQAAAERSADGASADSVVVALEMAKELRDRKRAR